MRLIRISVIYQGSPDTGVEIALCERLGLSVITEKRMGDAAQELEFDLPVPKFTVIEGGKEI